MQVCPPGNTPYAPKRKVLGLNSTNEITYLTCVINKVTALFSLQNTFNKDMHAKGAKKPYRLKRLQT